MRERHGVRRPVVLVVAGKRRLAFILSLALFWGLVGGALAAVTHRPVGTPGLAGRTIALDPGHGDIDSGATHRESALAEKDLTLDVARRLAGLIRRAGGRAVLTRPDDWESDLPDRQELHRRAGIAVKAGAEVLLSLHVDSHADPTCQYGQVFYHPSSTEGRRLAVALQAEFIRFQPDNYRQAGPADYYLLTCAKIPSVLVELGFLSHPEERRLLNTERYRQELAEVMFKGLAAYFTAPPPPAVPPLSAPLTPTPGR